MMYKLISLFAAIVLASAAIAHDDDTKTKRGSEATFTALDSDSDERLSRAEVSEEEEISEHFAALDNDSDGYLSEREFTAHMKPSKRIGREEY